MGVFEVEKLKEICFWLIYVFIGFYFVEANEIFIDLLCLSISERNFFGADKKSEKLMVKMISEQFINV